MVQQLLQRGRVYGADSALHGADKAQVNAQHLRQISGALAVDFRIGDAVGFQFLFVFGLFNCLSPVFLLR